MKARPGPKLEAQNPARTRTRCLKIQARKILKIRIFHKVFARQTDFYTAVWREIKHVVDTRPGEIEVDMANRWTCTMLRSAYYGGPMGLDTCLEAWGVNYQKDAAGRRARGPDGGAHAR